MIQYLSVHLVWLKYFLIIMQSVITNKSVVTFFGHSYIIYGNTVKKIR